MLLLQLVCSVQACRGRNLPDVMNDGVVLMYTTFTLTVVFGASFPIVYFQKQHEKEISQGIAVLLNNTVIMICLYGQKAFRMLMYPQFNTKEYFRDERMRCMKEMLSIEVRKAFYSS